MAQGQFGTYEAGGLICFTLLTVLRWPRICLQLSRSVDDKLANMGTAFIWQLAEKTENALLSGEPRLSRRELQAVKEALGEMGLKLSMVFTEELRTQLRAATLVHT